MFKFIRYIRLLIDLSRQAQTFLGESEQLLKQNEEDAEALRGQCRRIVVLAILFPVIYAGVVPIAVPWVAYIVRKPENPTGAAVATLIGLILSMASFLFYVFAGVALGCLAAHDDFLDRPVGQKWLELIGTKNHPAARVVCVITVLAGLIIAAGLAFVQLWIMSGPAFQH
ncbi:MAG TPA: hypothetical protein VH682_15185 [Gemmataceae bacterium]